jgi:threonine/homoserine/homoserine lactone efflux protein
MRSSHRRRGYRAFLIASDGAASVEHFLVLLSISAALAVGAVSPGPSFVLVARTAVAASREAGMATALGMGVGVAIFALAALLGLHALFNAVPWIYTAVKILGGLYLLYLAYRIWRGASRPLSVTSPAAEHTSAGKSLARAFLVGLGTQLSNPKTAIVFSSVFAALLPQNPPSSFYIALPLIAFSIDALWYTIVAFTLSSSTSRSAYLRYKKLVDRAAGGIMGALGIRLITLAR